MCNAERTDCACSNDYVTPKQFALCSREGVCAATCQAKGKARGACVGEGGWDCQCITLKEDGGEGMGRFVCLLFCCLLLKMSFSFADFEPLDLDEGSL